MGSSLPECFRQHQSISNETPSPHEPEKRQATTIYITALNGSLAILPAQHYEQGKENALYYLSRTLVEAEFKYTPIDKTCLAFMFDLKKLRNYLLEHRIK